MIIGTLALTGVGIPGIPYLGFAGFFSKDSIIEVAYAVGGTAGTFAFWLLVAAALMTSFYSWRLIHLTFHGKPRWNAERTRTSPPGRTGMTITPMRMPRTTTMATATRSMPHESPWVMLVPLFVLAAGAVLAGAVFYDSSSATPSTSSTSSRARWSSPRACSKPPTARRSG